MSTRMSDRNSMVEPVMSEQTFVNKADFAPITPIVQYMQQPDFDPEDSTNN